ncbi:MAG: fibronectin type III domain-containing protein, partial [Candidatus Kerfeldbacteria bacterium]|nr:fibronectin type III domain-containing protein [Candidatus Kerfeldbacteria bacterium]
YVAWVDGRDGSSDIYLQKFNTDGIFQWTNDLKVNYGSNTASLPQLAVDSSGKLIIAWQENDGSNDDIKAATFGTFTSTPTASVPLRVYGTKTIGKDAGNNDIYKFDDNSFITDGAGELNFNGSDQPKIEWDSYHIEIIDASYQLWQTEPLLPINVKPGTPNNPITLILKQTNAPRQITDLNLTNPTENSMKLEWTAPGNHGNIGTASSYDLRYSTSTINSSNWNSATPFAINPPLVADSEETATVTNLASDTAYYFAIRTTNSDSEVSVLSNIANRKTEKETIAPAVVSNLTAVGNSTTSIVLNWTAPGDDANVGTATSYDIRYSTSTINDGNWATATQATGEPAPLVAGTSQTMEITGLNPITTYYFGLKTSDEVPNVSNLSNIANAATLGAGWSQPQLTAVRNLSSNIAGAKIQTQGNYVYIIKASGNPNFIIIDASNPDNPTELAGALNLSGTLYNIAVDGNYAYIASSDNNKELQIINITNPNSPSLVGSGFDVTGTNDAVGIYKKDSIVYLTKTVISGADEFFVINVVNPSSPSISGSLNLSGSPREVVVLNNYAYIASSDNSRELVIVSIASMPPTLVTPCAVCNLAGNDNGLTIAGFDNTIILGRTNGISNGYLYLFDVATPTSPTLITTTPYNGQNVINDITFSDDHKYAFLATDYDSAEFQIVDIATSPSTPVMIGSYSSATYDFNGIAYNVGQDRIYLAGDDANNELVVLKPQQ